MGSIRVSNLGKAYKQYPSQLDRFLEWIFPLHTRHRLKWVVEGIDFSLEPGDAAGIIGVNGAGKSTLLKIIVGTISPTSGSVKKEGRIAALLELGMGFHSEFTGRQNIFMACQLQGLSTDMINNLMPEIEAFAEIGNYIDQPIRVYSSGMQMRLAFSVATAVRPDILIVDEALSVGDAYFQHKSFDRIKKFRESGTTLLFVSHSGESIKALCNRALLLGGGRLIKDGNPEEVLDYYNATLANHQNQKIIQVELPGGKKQTISGTGEARVARIEMLDMRGQPISLIKLGEVVELKITVEVLKNIKRLVLGYGIKNRQGIVIYGTNTHLKGLSIDDAEMGAEIEFSITFSANLGVGSYSIQTALVGSDTHLENNYEWRDMAHIFEVINIQLPQFVGVAWIDPDIKIKFVK
jgi:lipopolysaccharide transport system ATP-binding protein